MYYPTVTTSTQPTKFRKIATKELALLAGFLFFGLAVMPILIYFVGDMVFGAYGGVGYGDFFGTLSQKVRNGDAVACFLVLSPYLGWQCVRLTALAWRLAGRQFTV